MFKLRVQSLNVLCNPWLCSLHKRALAGLLAHLNIPGSVTLGIYSFSVIYILSTQPSYLHYFYSLFSILQTFTFFSIHNLLINTQFSFLCTISFLLNTIFLSKHLLFYSSSSFLLIVFLSIHHLPFYTHYAFLCTGFFSKHLLPLYNPSFLYTIFLLKHHFPFNAPSFFVNTILLSKHHLPF